MATVIQNRISVDMTDEQLTAALAAIKTLSDTLPFLITLTAEERHQMPKMGDKSEGFDLKRATFMETNGELMPAYFPLAEVLKDRSTRTKLKKIYATLRELTESIDDTIMELSSEIWSADLTYYHSARNASRRGVPGAEMIYRELSARFPGPGGGGRVHPEPKPIVTTQASSGTATNAGHETEAGLDAEADSAAIPLTHGRP